MPATATPTSPERTTAERINEADATTRTGEGSPKATPERKTPRVPTEIAEAVKLARYSYSGMNPKIVRKREADPKSHVPGASAGDHLRIRKFVTEKLGDEITPAQDRPNVRGEVGEDAPVDCAVEPDSDLSQIREFSANFRGSPYSQGRYAAAILCAWCDQLRAAAKAK